MRRRLQTYTRHVLSATQEQVTVEQVEEMLRHDARAALDAARQLLDAPGSDPDTVGYQRLLLGKGAAQAQLGKTEDGARVMREVREWAADHGENALLALSHRRMSALFRRVGDPALMLEHAVTAVDLLDDDADDAVRADHLLGLADALGANGSYEDSILRYREAAQLADGCDDAFLRSVVINNLAYTQYEAGHATEAVATAELLHAAAADGRHVLGSHDADTIARVYAAVGRLQEAAAVLEPVCTAAESGVDCDGLVCALLTLTEVRRRAGDIDAAQMSLDRVGSLIEEYALTGRRIEAMREQAELHAARGSFRDAFETFRAFHLADVELRALERDSRARTLHAIFEATEARRSSDFFRELSVRDPLTGLHNRRHMDEQLTELLEHLGDGQAQLTIALVDLDHFKRINDTRSHAAGDEVLRQIAGLLQDSADDVEGGLAARMGGEEFLLLLPDVGRHEGMERMDRLRRAIADHPWADVSDAIAVTASIGVAVAPEDETERGALIAVADKNLYRAKHDGRNCVAG